MSIRKYNYLLLLAFIGFSINTAAQQLPQYSNYMVNNFLLNPAVAGIDPYFIATSTNRYQWVGITDAPRTYILSVNGPTKTLKVGLGGTVYTDIVGPTRRTGMSLSYAYNLKVTQSMKLALGMTGGLLQFKVDASKVQLHDVSDAVLTNGIQSTLTPDFGFGFHLFPENKIWYVGGSVPQMIQNKVSFYNIQTATTSRYNRHYFFTGGYRFYLSEYIKLEPSTLIKYVSPAPAQYEFGMRFIYNNSLWLGGIYRTQDASAVVCGYTSRKGLVVIYSYDFTMSNIRRYSSGTHEVMLGLVFKKVKEGMDVPADRGE